jgi:hypothetical protein
MNLKLAVAIFIADVLLQRLVAGTSWIGSLAIGGMAAFIFLSVMIALERKWK